MSRQTSYSPQIDTLRALAILVVMLHHYIEGQFLLAGFGVVMFFLLSGFFGTRGLMRMRAKMEAHSVTPRQALLAFYQRRYWRIVPLYWLVIICAAIGGIEYARDAFFWNACFMTNLAMLRSNEWIGRFSQLWSLGVLEQFYLVWPAAILFLPKRTLVPLSLAGIVMAVLWRVFCDQELLSALAWTVVPFAGLDQLCTGALLALCTSDEHPIARKVLASVSRISVLLFCVIMAGRAFGFEFPYDPIYLPLIASLGFAWIVDGARREFGGWLGRILSSPLLSHCGRISFAAFLLHNVTELFLPRSPHVKQLLATNSRILILVPATFLFADLAWRFVEDPFQRLREKPMAEIWRNPRLIGEAFARPFIDVYQKLRAAIAMVPVFHRKLIESIAGTTV